MLKKVHIKNFLSCQDTEIEFDNVTALIGRNAAGKTNILKAIEWCAEFVVGKISISPPHYFSQHDKLEFETECCIDFLINEQLLKYEIKIDKNILVENLSSYFDDELELICDRHDKSSRFFNKKEVSVLEINSNISMIKAIFSLLPENKFDFKFLKTFGCFSNIKYYALDDHLDFDNEDKDIIFRISSAHSYSSKEWNYEKDVSVVMKLIHLWHKDEELFIELKQLIGKNGLNLIDDINVKKVDMGFPDDFYIVRFHILKHDVDYTQLSYGTRRVLILLLALLHDKNSTILVEQPEDGIHSGLLTKLLPLCFQYAEVYNKQLIIATHSPEIINLLPPESIRLVKMTENGTKVSALSKEQMPFIHDYLQNEGALFDFIESMDDE